MASIFLSYAREDANTAKAIASELEARGWSVFWDRKILPGATFDDYIVQQLQDARAVLVLWSPISTASDWVRNEAAHGKDRAPSALVPAIIAPCQIPFAFRHIQAVDLSAWRAGVPSEESVGPCPSRRTDDTGLRRTDHSRAPRAAHSAA